MVVVESVGVPSTTGGPSGTLVGTYQSKGRSLPVNATGNMAPLGPANVTGSITISGPKSSESVYGVLNVIGKRGSIKLQVEANDARTPGKLDVGLTVIVAKGTGLGELGATGAGVLTLGHWIGSTIVVSQGLYPQASEQAAHGHFGLRVELNPQGR